MSDELEIIIQATDDASSVFQAVAQAASGMGEDISSALESASEEMDGIVDTSSEVGSAVEQVGSSFDSMGSAGTSELDALEAELEEATAEVERLEEALDQAHFDGDDIEADALADALAEATAEAEALQDAIDSIESGSIEDATGSAEEFEGALGDIDGSVFDEVAGAADNAEQEIEGATQAVEEFGSAGDVMAAQSLMDMTQGMTNSMMSAADSAGNFSDSLTRLSLVADGTGIPIEDMTASVTRLSGETGRAGGVVRESFISMSAAGITSLDSMEKMFAGVSAQSFILQTDVGTLANKFASLAMRSSISTRNLKGTGITVEELGDAMDMHGASLDEINEKWETLDTNSRAAILGEAASMNEGKNANEEYKNSWQGLGDQLNIAKGRLERLAGDVLLPVLVPAIEMATSFLNSLGDAVSSLMGSPLGGLISILGTAAGAFMIVVTGASALSAILGFLKVEATLTAIETAALTFAEEMQAGASITSAAANAIGATGFGGLAAAAWGAAAGVWAALAPLLPFIAAAAAVVVIIYEVGKAFGWWTDVGSMIDAITSGVQRLWNAFINHPDVQAAIKAITDGWNWFVSAVTQAGQAVLDFFGINQSGSFDIVRAIIDSVGAAWDTLKGAVSAVIGVLVSVGEALAPVFETIGEAINKALEALQPFFDLLMQIAEFVGGALVDGWNTFVEVLGIIGDAVGQLMEVFGQFQSGQIDLVTALTSIWDILTNMFTTVFSIILQRLANFSMALIQAGINAATQFVQFIVARIQTLPGKIYNLLMQVLNYVRSVATQWVNTARQKAQALVTGVVSFLQSLPGRAYSALVAVASRVASALQQAVSTARSKAQELVNTAVSIISGLPGRVGGALSGLVEAIVAPFRDAYNQAKSWIDKIANIRIPGMGGEDLPVSEEINIFPANGIAAGGEDLIEKEIVYSGTLETGVGSSNMVVDGSVDMNIKLDGLPDSVDTNTVVKIFEDLFNSPNFKDNLFKEIAKSKVFQNLDAKEKNKLLNQSNRARGV